MKYKTQLSPVFEQIFTEYKRRDEAQTGGLTSRGIFLLRQHLKRLELAHPEWKGVKDFYAYIRAGQDRELMLMLGYTEVR